MHRLLQDAFVAAQIDDALAPFAGRVTAEDLAWMRAALAALLEDDPHAADLLAAAYPRTVDDSGQRVKPLAGPGHDAVAVAEAAGGKVRGA